eukprot:7868022-Pyramimonas_sp.AAC.1
MQDRLLCYIGRGMRPRQRARALCRIFLHGQKLKMMIWDSRLRPRTFLPAEIGGKGAQTNRGGMVSN